MFAAANNKSDKVSPDVAREYINSTPSYAFPKLAERIGKKPTQTSKPKQRKGKYQYGR